MHAPESVSVGIGVGIGIGVGVGGCLSFDESINLFPGAWRCKRKNNRGVLRRRLCAAARWSHLSYPVLPGQSRYTVRQGCSVGLPV